MELRRLRGEGIAPPTMGRGLTTLAKGALIHGCRRRESNPQSCPEAVLRTAAVAIFATPAENPARAGFSPIEGSFVHVQPLRTAPHAIQKALCHGVRCVLSRIYAANFPFWNHVR